MPQRAIKATRNRSIISTEKTVIIATAKLAVIRRTTVKMARTEAKVEMTVYSTRLTNIS